jgi:hypothetical protein
MAALFNGSLSDFGESLQQPGQRDFQPDMIFRDIEMAGRRLPERTRRSCDPLPIAPHRLSTPARWQRRASVPP